jgi:RNA polymerase sigma factor (TIGR02999 family)
MRWEGSAPGASPIDAVPADGAHAEGGARPGDGQELPALAAAVYDELRAIARRHLAAAGAPAAGTTLTTTGLVHEAYLKLVGPAEEHGVGRWRDRPHFLATAAVAMRQILVDRARARAAHKRGGAGARVTLDEDAVAVADAPEALLEVDDALDQLAGLSPRLARVVECRFYGGMTEEEIAAALGVTVRTVQRDWAKARMLLRRALAA